MKDYKALHNIGKQIIYNADCLILLKEIKNIDVIVTSPPYNIGVKYASYIDELPELDYLNWLKLIFAELKECLKIDGSFFLNIGSTLNNPWIAFDVANVVRETFHLQNHIVWAKSISIGEESHGHFKPINSDRFLNHNFEHIFHFTKNNDVKLDKLSIGVPYADKSNIKRWNQKQDKRDKGNIWFVPYKTIKNRDKDKSGHPAIYPVELVKNCIKLHGITENMVVLDPFVGQGTTLVACEQLGVDGIGIEIDENYYEAACDNIERIVKNDRARNG